MKEKFMCNYWYNILKKKTKGWETNKIRDNMARKTLGKMEFADLIKNLQDQNSSLLDAQ